MTEKRDLLEKLDDIPYSLEEWIGSIINNPNYSWCGFDTKCVMGLIEDLLQELRELLKSANGTISKAEKKVLQKLTIKTKAVLKSHRKERQL